jgi:hypothetical protein
MLHAAACCNAQNIADAGAAEISLSLGGFGRNE